MIVLTRYTSPVVRIQFAPTGPLLVVAHVNQSLGVWDAEAQRLVAEYGIHHRSFGAGARFHPTRPRILTAGAVGEVQSLDPVAADGDDLCHRAGLTYDALMTRDERRLLVAETGHSEFRLFDLTRGPDAAPVWSVPIFASNAGGILPHVEFLPDETRFVVAENHKNKRTRVAVRSLETGKLLDSQKLPYQTTAGLAVSPDGANVAVATANVLRVYDTAPLSKFPRYGLQFTSKHLTGVAYHPSGRYLAVTSNDETVRVLDADRLAVVKSFAWKIGKLRAIAFAPDGLRAAVGGDTGQVVVWDVD